MLNPLFPTADNSADAPTKEERPVERTPKRDSKRLEPLPRDGNPAANLIRQKLDAIYGSEPDAEQELAEAEAAGRHRSKHQKFIEELQSSGKSLAEVQTAWHNYYVALPDDEKHEVWQEFYETAKSSPYGKLTSHNATSAVPQKLSEPAKSDGDTSSNVVVADHQPPEEKPDKRTLADTRKALLGTIQTRTRLKPRDHLKSLVFGLACGFIVIAIFLFSFFNEVIIAPFIQPGRNVSNIPLIVDASAAADTSPQVIIPKINVDIPVDYTQTSTDENVIENALNSGVVHYPNTVMPGQNGNAAFFGHSSNNIFNPGKYKFAFVLLHTLVNGDTFYLTYNGKIYAYQVIDHKVVPPSDVGVLTDTEGHPATATLITCDPPGTSINRLVVTGVQISPNPTGNAAQPASPQVSAQPAALPGNGPSLWSRFIHWIF